MESRRPHGNIQLQHERDVAVYMDRHRGTVSLKNTFLVCTELRGITWYVEPLNKCGTFEDVRIGHSIQDENLLIDGFLTTEILEIHLLRVSREDLYTLVAKAFGKSHQCTPPLPLFVDARVKIRSLPLDIGTIRDVIKKLQSFD